MHTPATVVAAMNRAATQDLRAVEVLPQIVAVLRLGKAPSARDERMLQLLADWNAKGSARLDRDLDGFVDAPGAAILDAAWPKLADAVLGPVLGPLTERLAALIPRDDGPSPSGSAYGAGWYGYVQKDLRAVLGRSSQSPFRIRYCGRANASACAASLWAALDAAGDELERAQGPNPDAWHVSAAAERIRFAGFLDRTMRWANRPTFQQVVVFRSHR
jgi:hypothetical protein